MLVMRLVDRSGGERSRIEGWSKPNYRRGPSFVCPRVRREASPPSNRVRMNDFDSGTGSEAKRRRGDSGDGRDAGFTRAPNLTLPVKRC